MPNPILTRAEVASLTDCRDQLEILVEVEGTKAQTLARLAKVEQACHRITINLRQRKD
jgi:hypothetical protein